MPTTQHEAVEMVKRLREVNGRLYNQKDRKVLNLPVGYYVRVTLHGVPDDKSWAEYEKLHKAMEANGFVRKVSVDGTEYHLLPAMYYHPLSMKEEQVLDYAEDAIATTGYKFGIHFDGPDEVKAVGLEPV